MTGARLEQVRAHLEPELVCPHCGEQNSPTSRAVQIEDNGIVICNVCVHVGPLATFQPPCRTEGWLE